VTPREPRIVGLMQAFGQAVPRWLLALGAIASLVFLFVPQIDLAVSGYFAQGTAGFPLRQAAWISLLNDNVLKVSRWASGALLVLWLLSLGVPASTWLGARRRPVAFLLFALVLGPGLIVNALLKDVSGRARPVQIEQFGGPRQFTPAFVIADQCERNCSFVSGHVAAATMPAAGYFLAATRRRRRLWLAAGLTLGVAAGIARIVVGAHFLSDVVMAMLITWMSCALVAALMFGRREPAAAARRDNDLKEENR